MERQKGGWIDEMEWVLDGMEKWTYGWDSMNGRKENKWIHLELTNGYRDG